MARFAERTSVGADDTRDEIQRTLNRYGAEEFAYASRADAAMIAFAMHNRRVKFYLPLPQKLEFLATPTGMPRKSDAVHQMWEQACRQRWRALFLAIKAKLEAVEVGITTFEDEFLAHIILADGRTVGDHVKPGIAISYERGEVQALLPPPG